MLFPYKSLFNSLNSGLLVDVILWTNTLFKESFYLEIFLAFYAFFFFLSKYLSFSPCIFFSCGFQSFYLLASNKLFFLLSVYKNLLICSYLSHFFISLFYNFCVPFFRPAAFLSSTNSDLLS